MVTESTLVHSRELERIRLFRRDERIGDGLQLREWAAAVFAVLANHEGVRISRRERNSFGQRYFDRDRLGTG